MSAILDSDKPASYNKQQSSSPSVKCPLHPNSSHAASDCRTLRIKLADPIASCPVNTDADHNAAECKFLKRSIGKAVSVVSKDRSKKADNPACGITCFKCNQKG